MNARHDAGGNGGGKQAVVLVTITAIKNCGKQIFSKNTCFERTYTHTREKKRADCEKIVEFGKGSQSTVSGITFENANHVDFVANLGPELGVIHLSATQTQTDQDFGFFFLSPTNRGYATHAFALKFQSEDSGL